MQLCFAMDIVISQHGLQNRGLWNISMQAYKRFNNQGIQTRVYTSVGQLCGPQYRDVIGNKID